MSNILALDASTKSTGYALFNNKGELIKYGVWTASGADLIKRIKKISKEFNIFLTTNHVDIIIMEEVRPDGQKNQNVSRALNWLQASFNFILHENFSLIKLEYIYPSSWRSKCGIHTGRGVKREELKKADIAFANKTYNLNITNDDIADAICIGHAYFKKDSKWG